MRNKKSGRAAEIKMKSRTTYNDLGLVFAKDWSHVTKHGNRLGDPPATEQPRPDDDPPASDARLH